MIGAMLANSTDFKTVDTFIDDPGWVFEQKADGNRILLSTQGGDAPAVAITRNGTRYTKRLSEAMKNFRWPHQLTLDGELVGDDFWVFDIPEVANKPMMLNLGPRRQELESLFATGLLDPFRLIPQASTPEDKQMMLDLAIARGWEGLMVKRKESAYRAGRSQSWLKAKQTQTADVVVIEIGRDGKEAATLAAIDPERKEAVEVGQCSLIGKPPVKLLDVVEVKYLYLGVNQRLYQPTLLRVRDDKLPAECLTTQFRHVNKTMLATLPK